MSDTETMLTMLRSAVETRRSKISAALADLNKIVGEMSNAVTVVSDGRAKLVLQKLKSNQQSSVYGLIFTAEEDETVIRIFEFSELGYPITCFDSLERTSQRAKMLRSVDELRFEILPLLSEPASKLVRLLEYTSEPLH